MSRQNPIQHEDELIPILLQNKDFLEGSKLEMSKYTQHRAASHSQHSEELTVIQSEAKNPSKLYNAVKYRLFGKPLSDSLIPDSILNPRKHRHPELVSGSNSNYKNLKFNLPQFMSFNLTHLTKLSFAALTIFTLLAGGVAAQALAPDSYKPTQVAQSIKDKYFSANKQKDADPAVALIPDNSNSLINFDDCNLKIKYPNFLGSNKVKFSKASNDNQNSNEININYEDFGTNGIKLSCGTSYDRQTYLGIGEPNPYEKPNTSRNITVLELQKTTGWFITSEILTNLVEKTAYSKGVPSTIEYSFKFNDKIYVITKSLLASNKNPILDSTNFQVQLNSLKENNNICYDKISTTNKDLFISKFEDQQSFGITYSSISHELILQDKQDLNSVEGKDLVFGCYKNLEGGLSYFDGENGITNSNAKSIPYLSDEFRSTVKNVKVIGFSEKRGASDYYFETNDGIIYHIAISGLDTNKNEFGITIK
jgi:hypothetical protein